MMKELILVALLCITGCKQETSIPEQPHTITQQDSSPQHESTPEETPWDRLMGEPSLKMFPKEKLNELERMAKEGNAFAQANWAVVLGKGIGMTPDTDQAVKWFVKAAEQGLHEIQIILGIIYENGVMVEKDAMEAAKWYQMASDQGNAQASMLMAAMYQTGRDGIPIDEAETIKWMTKSAKQGSNMAQGFLGTAYTIGFGVAEDNVTALAWFDVAIANGYPLAGSMRDHIFEELTPEEKAEAQRLAKIWLEKYPYSPPMEPIL